MGNIGKSLRSIADKVDSDEMKRRFMRRKMHAMKVAGQKYIDASERHVIAASAIAEDRNQIAGEIFDAKSEFLAACGMEEGE